MISPCCGADATLSQRTPLASFAVTAVTLAFLRHAFAFRAAIGGKRTANGDLLCREETLASARDVPSIALVRLNQWAGHEFLRSGATVQPVSSHQGSHCALIVVMQHKLDAPPA